MKKAFLLIWLPVAILLGGILGLIYYSESKSEKTILETNETNHVNHQIKTITADLDYVVSDLIFLSEQHELQKLLDKSHDYSTKDLAKDYLSLSLRKGLYDQIRFIDEKGMEVVRVNYYDCEPCVVPDEELQFKGNRYYFRDTFELDRGEVFVSPFDLNIERGEIEKPLKPMIRLGTPVFDGKGRKRGIVILNYFGSVLLDNIREMSSTLGKAMLLNAGGYWLLSPSLEDEWGFMLEENKEKRFGNAFPDAWQRISRAESGQFYSADGLFSFATVYPLLEGQNSSTGSKEPFAPSASRLGVKDYYWKVVSHVPPEILNQRSHDLLRKLIPLYAVLLVLAAIGAWLIAKANLRHKEAEDALKESERKYRSLAESTKTIPWKIDLSIGRFTYIGRQVEEILGYPSESWVDINTWSERIHPEDREEATRFCSEARKRGEDHDFEYRSVAADGRVVWIRDIVSVVKEDKVPKELIGVMIDITDRKTAEEALRRSHDLLDAIGRAQSQFITDAESTVLFDELLDNLLSLTNSEHGFIGEVLYTPEGVPYLKTHAITNIAWNIEMLEFYEKNAPDGMEFRNLKTLFGAVLTTGKQVISNDPSTDPRSGGIPEGHPTVKAFLGIPFHSGDRLVGMVGIANRPVGYDEELLEYLQPLVATCANIVEAYRGEQLRLQAEESLRKAKEEAEEATRLKDKFVSLVSHDLKNPIQRIMGYFNLIESTQQISKQGKEMIEEGLFACKDMTTLIGEILNLSRIKGGRIMPEYSFVHAVDIADSAIKDYTLMANEKGIDLINDIPKDTRLYADEKLLLEVVRNLISNSVKFCEKGDTIRLYLPDGEASTIAVADTGRGMETDWLKTLFKYEEKTSRTGTSGERGTGFGLPLARDIMKAHGGDLHVESTLGEGSTFYVRLSHVRPKVLIVDDEQIIIDLIKDRLKVTDVDYLEAVTGKMAQEVIKQNLPHLILLDISMTDMNGLELLEYIKSNPITRKIPVIVITGDPKVETRDRVFELGADDFISKPFNTEDLIPRVRRFVG